MGDVPIQAIPTTYNGVQLRSRMEAQCALLFDTLDWKWEYEPESIMLPNGVAYRPDFWLPEHCCVVECRGYESEKGKAQIDGFRDLLKEDRLESAKFDGCVAFLTIGPKTCEYLWNYTGSPVQAAANICWCEHCSGFVPSCEFVEFCNRCRDRCWISHPIRCEDGRVTIGGYTSDEWSSCDLYLKSRTFNLMKLFRSLVRQSATCASRLEKLAGTPEQLKEDFARSISEGTSK